MSSVTHESAEMNNGTKNRENHKQQFSRDVMLGSELWTDGLLCAFEFVRSQRKTNGARSTEHHASREPKKQPLYKREASKFPPQDVDKDDFIEPHRPTESRYVDIENGDGQSYQQDYPYYSLERSPGSYWIPIGWARISELLQTVNIDSAWASQPVDLSDEEDDVTVADVAAPYWQRPVGPTWWCHVAAGHPSVNAWLSKAQWLHPAISTALRDESKLISERMKHLLYEVPVRVAGGLLFELLGQSVGDPYVEEDDIPAVIRSWQAQNFLITALHVKGSASNINVIGIAEVQELLAAGSSNVPRTIHEVVALLACRLARWDDRLYRKYIFGAADEAELKFMNRRTHEDVQLFSVILNQEIRRLSTQVIRVKWSLHAREEIVFELLQHLRGNTAKILLQGILKSTRQMIGEQEAVRGRLFTIQDVMQSTVRAWLQDRSLRVQHNLGVFGGCGLVLSIITGLFGINVDGIPGNQGAPYAFAFFSLALVVVGAGLIAIGLIYLGLKKPFMEEQVEVRKLELQELVKMFQHEAESHVQVRKDAASDAKKPVGSTGITPDGDKYVVIS
ncbi:hypothetical protein P3S68_025510 [Capsicum galapagoense]